ITEDGENGKHINRNSTPNPCRSNHSVTIFTCLFFRIALNIRLSPSLRTNKKTQIPPDVAPIHDHKNPFTSPYAAPLAITNTIKGKNGRKDSTNGNKIPGNGPRLSYSFSSCIM